MSAPHDDGLAPHPDAIWQAIDRRIADIEQGLTWGDLVQARLALRDLPGSLRMLGLAGAAGAAETLWQGFQTDPRHADRLTELGRLALTLATARRSEAGIPIAEAALLPRALVVAAESVAEGFRGLRVPGWRITVVTRPDAAAVWLRMSSLAVVIWDPAAEAFGPDWLEKLPTGLPVFGIGPAERPVTATLPATWTPDELAGLLAPYLPDGEAAD